MAAEVAKLYANALFELYMENGSDEAIHKQLNEYADIFRANPELIQLLAAPLLTNEEKRSVISKIFDDCGLIYDYLCLLCDKNRSDHFCEIADEFNNLYNKYKNIAEIVVITSIPLTEDLRSRLIDRLAKKLAKTIILKEKIDPDIIDGIIVEYNNKRLDDSVRSRLETIRNAAVDASV